ncbi:hypothetical protein UlMin_024810 [Ulmus minor]
MTDFGDKDTIRLRIGDQKLDSSIVVEESETKLDNQKPQGIKYLPNPWESSPGMWDKIFLISCVIGVLIDPLFLYIPVINEDNKCLRRDETMKILAIFIRSITDFAYILQMAVRLGSASKMAKKLHSSKWTRLPWSYLLIDILAILPLPQVIFQSYFHKMAGSKSLITRKFLNFFLLAQYVPRILRIYLSAKDLGRTFDSLTLRLWVRGVFNIFLYIIAGHVFGGLWYFHSILSETNCWHKACKWSTKGECKTDDASFYCGRESTPKIKVEYLNKECPVNPQNPPNEKHFGIFADAIESRILVTEDFPKKFSKCFWWGLRNLSSFGQNLDTSSNIWENLFAVLISILGLLLFLYFIGNVQTYMQLATTQAEEARQKISAKEPEIRSYLSNHGFPNSKVDDIIKYIRQIIRKGKELDVDHLLSLLGPVEGNKDHEQHENVAEFVIKTVNTKKLEKNTTYRSTELYKWISDNGIPNNMKQEIMQHMRLRLQEGKDVDVVNILGALPHSLVQFVREHLCLDTLKKVPMIKTKYGLQYEIICKYLKPVTYSENTYIIRKGEPLDMIVFITQGIVWSFNETSMQRLQKGDYFGNELLEWELENSKSFSTVPRSPKNVKAHTKVEAFALKAANLEQAFKDFNSLVTKLQRRYRTHRHPNTM